MAGGINKVILVGNLGRDPEVRQVGNTQKAYFPLATSRPFTDKQGNKQEKTQWHRVIVWGQLAEQVQRFTQKGRKVYVEGSLETREFESNGEKQRVVEVNARQVEFLDRPKEAESSQARSAAGYGGYGVDTSPMSESDVPF